jgi:hypothetical protein
VHEQEENTMTITAYPLQWPAAWKRTNAAWRVQAKFGKARRQTGYGENQRWTAARDLTIAEGTERVLTELKRMGLGRDDVVISTNLRLRLDGLPHSSQSEPADPGVAVYWQDSMQARKVMAIDIYDRVADNLAAVAATLEAMRAIERHGGAAILERAFTGFTALPAPIIAGMKRHWRDVLRFELSDKPTSGTISDRYRKLASAHHPDREGGDDAKMSELNAARDEALKEVCRG